jgi:hypothetical protein
MKFSFTLREGLEDAGGQGTEENIWSVEGPSNNRSEKTV